jgi:hypothetical protein
LSNMFVTCHCRTCLSLVIVGDVCHLSLSEMFVTCHCRTFLSLVIVEHVCHLSLSDMFVTCHCRRCLSLVIVRDVCHLSLSNIFVTCHCRTVLHAQNKCFLCTELTKFAIRQNLNQIYLHKINPSKSSEYYEEHYRPNPSNIFPRHSTEYLTV